MTESQDSMKNRRERQKEIRKELIIDAAVRVMHRVGFEQATMDQIAEEADVAKGTLYLYFKSKNEIYLAVHIRGSKELNETMKEILLQSKTGMEILDALGNAYLHFIRKYPIYFMASSYYENLLSNSDLSGSALARECEKYGREAMTYIVRALQIGVQDGSVSSTHDPYKLGLIIWSASRGVIHAAQQANMVKDSFKGDESDFASLLTIFITVLRTGIKNDRKSENLQPLREEIV